MSYPPGPSDPNDPDEGRGARDPWATPSGDQPPPPGPEQQPESSPPPGQPGQPPYGQPVYGQPGYGQPYGQQPPYPPAYGQPAPYGYPPRTNGKATAALWSGIGALVLSLCCGAGILGIVPIILGVKARGEIRSSGGQQQGDGIALAGIITGAVAVVLSIAIIVVIVIAIASGDANFDTSTTGV
jgi:hypothetical protein